MFQGTSSLNMALYGTFTYLHQLDPEIPIDGMGVEVLGGGNDMEHAGKIWEKKIVSWKVLESGEHHLWLA